MATCSSADSVLEASSLIKANSEKLDKFVNGTDTQTVQLGSGAATPVIRNIVKQIKADASWAKQHIADAPEGDVSLNNAAAMWTSVSRTLAERFADVINVKDYGAVGDGVTDDKEAIQDAIDAAQDGDIIVFPSGTYAVSGGIQLKSNITVDGQGSKIIYSGSMYLFKADGSLDTTEIKLTSNTGREATTIELVSTANVSRDEWYLLFGQRDAYSLNAGEEFILGAATASQDDICFAEPICVRNISGNAVTLRSPLVFKDYNININDEDDTSIYVNTYSFVKKLNFVENLTVKNFTIESSSNMLVCVYFTYCRNCEVLNVKNNRSVFDSPGQVVTFKWCLNCTAFNCSMRRAGGTGFTLDHSNYNSFKIVSSWYCTMNACTDENGVQGFDITTQNVPGIFPVVENCRAFNNTECGLTSHSGTYGLVVRGCFFKIGSTVSGTAPAGLFLRSPYTKVFGNMFIFESSASGQGFGIRVYSVPTYVNHNSSNISTYRSCFQNTEIKNNVFHRIMAPIHVSAGYCDSNGIGHMNVIIEDNVFYHTTNGIRCEIENSNHSTGWDSIDSNLIIKNNTFTRSRGWAIGLWYCNRALIKGNVIKNVEINWSQFRAIYANDSNNVKNIILEDNLFQNIISGYAISENIAQSEGVFLKDNRLIGTGNLCSVDIKNATSVLHNEFIRGTAWMPAGTSSITVSHPLGHEPEWAQVIVFPTGSDLHGATCLYIASKTDTEITFATDVAVSPGISIAYVIMPYGRP